MDHQAALLMPRPVPSGVMRIEHAGQRFVPSSLARLGATQARKEFATWPWEPKPFPGRFRGLRRFTCGQPHFPSRLER